MTSSDLIDGLVAVHCGQSDAHTKRLFQQSLEALVELAKAEQIKDIAEDALTHYKQE